MAISLTHPLPGSTPTDKFGWRAAIPSIGLPAQLHNGQDYAAPGGTPIRAAHSGRVIWSNWDVVGGGWGVQVQHPEGWSTLYLHMQTRSTDVAVGQNVSAGQTIGRVGATGLATGNHLHFMLRNNGSDINPVPFIRSTPKPTPKPKPKPPVGQEEDDEMEPRYIADSKVGTQGTVYQLTSAGRKRAIPSAEWRAIRAVESAGGGKLSIGLVAAADLKKIPNA